MSCKHGNHDETVCDLCCELNDAYNLGWKGGYSKAVWDATWVCREMGAKSPIEKQPFGYQYAEAIKKPREGDA